MTLGSASVLPLGFAFERQRLGVTLESASVLPLGFAFERQQVGATLDSARAPLPGSPSSDNRWVGLGLAAPDLLSHGLSTVRV